MVFKIDDRGCNINIAQQAACVSEAEFSIWVARVVFVAERGLLINSRMVLLLTRTSSNDLAIVVELMYRYIPSLASLVLVSCHIY